jgi:hypothetical protein
MKLKTIIYVLILTGFLFLLPNTKVNAQTKVSIYGKDSVKSVEAISLYREYYKQWKSSKYKNESINDAIPYWRWVFANCPRAKQRTFLDGQRMYKHFIENEKDEAKKEKLIDTLMLIYDTRIQIFNNRGKILARKGCDYFRYRTADFEGAYNIIKESVELEKNKSETHILNYYFRLTRRMVLEKKADIDLIFSNYDEIMSIVNYNLKKNEGSGKAEKWVNLKGNIEAIFEEFATYEDIVKLYSEKLALYPNNIELLKKIILLLDKKNYKEEPFYIETTIKLYELEPSPESAYYISKVYLNDADYKKALIYLQKSCSMEDHEKLADIYYYMSYCTFQLKNYSATRTNARKALKYNPKMGKAYIMIGDCYAITAKRIGKDELKSRVAYWAAVDKYYQAKKVDKSVINAANKRISDYKKQFPTKEKLFYYLLNIGDEYKVGGWINEVTTVRSSD